MQSVARGHSITDAPSEEAKIAQEHQKDPLGQYSCQPYSRDAFCCANDMTDGVAGYHDLGSAGLST